jgi:NosR/NirI family nitrous oxide reductase transcriptional regulator
MLWPVKYIVLAALVGTVFVAPAFLGTAAEVEPFKTAITLKFDRAWPYVLYAVVLLVLSLTIERAFCRFLCPLGALLALGGKFRMRSPLLRRNECGNPCQLCSNRCPVQAIAPTGKIIMDECFYCLDCQVIYHDEHQCPPLVTMTRRTTKSIDIPVLAD